MTNAKPKSDKDEGAKISGERSDLGQVRDTLAESLEKPQPAPPKDKLSSVSTDVDKNA